MIINFTDEDNENILNELLINDKYNCMYKSDTIFVSYLNLLLYEIIFEGIYVYIYIYI